MTSNIVDLTLAKRIADEIRESGGHVFAVVPAGTLIAALALIKKDFEKADPEATGPAGH
jgi:hypothetical protein